MTRQKVIEAAIMHFQKRRKKLEGFGYSFEKGKQRALFYNGLSQDQVHMTFSVTKTVTSLALGMCLKELNEKVELTLKAVFKHFLFEDPRVGTIKLHDLLTMSSGFEWDEKEHFKSADLTMPWTHESNLVEYALKRPLNYTPGTVFNYDSLNSHILSGVIKQMTGKSIQDYCTKKLFEPLEMTSAIWELDSMGLGYGGHGLSLTLADLLVLGEALQNKALLNQWVGESYYEGMKKGFFKVPQSNYAYGYHTWIGKLGQQPYFAAFGHGGQRIICLSEGGVLVSFGKIWPEFGPLDRFFEEWLNAESDQ